MYFVGKTGSRSTQSPSSYLVMSNMAKTLGCMVWWTWVKCLYTCVLRNYFSRSISFFFFFFFWLLGLHLLLQHMEGPRLGVESKLQLPAYATSTAMQDPIWVCDLHWHSQQCWIPIWQSEARDWTCTLMDISWVHYHWATMRTLGNYFSVHKFPHL